VRSSRDEPGTWHAAPSGDADAFVALFDLHHNRVYRHALRMTANTHDAEDVTAAAFLELWRRRKSVRVVDGSILPWLLVTATNVARNLARGLRRHRALIGALPRAEAASSAADIAVERIEDPLCQQRTRPFSLSQRSSTIHLPKRQPPLASPMARAFTAPELAWPLRWEHR